MRSFVFSMCFWMILTGLGIGCGNKVQQTDFKSSPALGTWVQTGAPASGQQLVSVELKPDGSGTIVGGAYPTPAPLQWGETEGRVSLVLNDSGEIQTFTMTPDKKYLESGEASPMNLKKQ